MKIGYSFVIISFFILLAGVYAKSSDENIFHFFMALTVITGGISLILLRNLPSEKKTSEDNLTSTNDQSKLVFSVSGALYAVIAGFAIKNATDFVVTHFTTSDLLKDTTKDYFTRVFDTLQVNTEIKMGVIFLVMAVPFYHGAMMFLSDKSKKAEEKPIGLTWHFVILFVQALIFLGISATLDKFDFVVVLLVFLMIIDSVWIIVGQKTKNKPPVGWLSLNLCFTGILFLSLYKLPNIDSLNLLFCSSIIRTAVDYLGFKHIYSKY